MKVTAPSATVWATRVPAASSTCSGVAAIAVFTESSPASPVSSRISLGVPDAQVAPTVTSCQALTLSNEPRSAQVVEKLILPGLSALTRITTTSPG